MLMLLEETSAKYGPGASVDTFAKPSVLLVKMTAEAFVLVDNAVVSFDDVPLMKSAISESAGLSSVAV